MVLSPILYDDSQTQSPAPIPAQPPMPAGVQIIEISWDRDARWMRAIIGSQKWHFKELLGRAQIIGTDNARGRIHARAMARVEGETFILYRAPDAVPHPKIEGIERLDSHQRLCYRRSHRDWRVRDERRPEMPDALMLGIAGYLGDFVAEKEAVDPIAHLYHNGPIIVEEGTRIAHLYDLGL